MWMPVAYFYVWTSVVVINLPSLLFILQGISIPVFHFRCLSGAESNLVSLTQRRRLKLTHATSMIPQELLPERATVCLCRSLLQTGCLQQQHPWCSGIVTSPLFHQLTCVSHLTGFYHLSPVCGPIFSVIFFIILILFFISKNPVTGTFEFVTPPEDASRPSPPQQKLLMFATFDARTNWETMCSYIAANGCKKRISQNN